MYEFELDWDRPSSVLIVFRYLVVYSVYLHVLDCIYPMEMHDLCIIKNIFFLPSVWAGGVEEESKFFINEIHLEKL